MDNSRQQAKFYDNCPPLIPWPGLLLSSKFSRLYKPREVFWKRELDRLGMKKNQRVLDVGCGQGLFLARMSGAYGVKGVGIDVSRESIKHANEKYADRNISFNAANSTKIPFNKETFNYVVSFDVLEHITDQDKAVAEMMRVLKPGGKLLIYTLSKNYFLTLDWIWEKLGMDIYSRAAHDPKLFVDQKKLRKTILSNGGKVLDIELFDAFFTLLIDEAIMVSASISRKLGLFENKIFGEVFLFLASLISRLLFAPAYFLDKLWFWHGYSLSFIIIAKKKWKREN